MRTARNAGERRPRGSGPSWSWFGRGQGGLWAFLLVRFALTGGLLADIPVDGQHLVFALDLALLAPTLVVAGILLFRRTAAGLVMGAAVSLFGLVYQVNLMLAGVFQDVAGVVGVKAFPIEGIVFTLGFAIASAALLVRWMRPDRARSR